MVIPSYRGFFGPVLAFLVEQGIDNPIRTGVILKSVVDRAQLTDDERNQKTDTGRPLAVNRVEFALTYMRRDGLIINPSRGRVLITPDGLKFLNGEQPVQDTGGIDSQNNQELTPEEMMAKANREIKSALTSDLLYNLNEVSPSNFERLCVRLLEEMGYGTGTVVGRSGDQGIDGIIKQDSLGLETVYVQAKRQTNPVNEPDIRNFSGSLDAKGATKGVFITNSTFSNSARNTAASISAGPKRIVLIDGEELAQLMIKYQIGVIVLASYDVMALDANYFAEDAFT